MQKQPSQIAEDLTKLVAGDVFADIIHRVAYSTDASSYRIVPQCVVAPRDVRDVVAVVRYAADHGLPLAARGAGSGLAGESLCSGIVIDMTRYLRRILRLDGETATCEPGVVLDDLNKQLAEFRSKIGPDPSSGNRATIGGIVANNATGAHSLQYGHIAAYVESIEAVLPDGNIVELHNGIDVEQVQKDRMGLLARECWSLLTASKPVVDTALPATARNRCGYNVGGVCHGRTIDLARLLAGSEGTLAVFTRLTLRTVPLPAAKGLLQLEFDSLDRMARAVPAIIETNPAACELMDQMLIEMACQQLPQYRDILPTGAAAVLLIEQVGAAEAEVREKIDATDRAVGSQATGRTIITEPKAQARVWKSRKDAGPLLYRKRSRKHPAEFMEDVSVDHRHLADYLAGLARIEKKYDITMCFFGHAGDGELHVRPYIDLGDPADREKMLAMARDVYTLAWSLGGTISGEHAVGLIRAGFVRGQYGDEYYGVLQKVKGIFDPGALMNPGKILNDDPDVMFRNLRRGPHILPERAKSELLFRDSEHELELEQCYGCGLCLSREPALRMCPVFRATGEELGSSRAKANLLHYWATGQLDEKDFESPEFRRFLDLCVSCKMCERQCPSGVDVSTLMMAARAEYARRRGWRRAEQALSHNRWLSRMGSAFAPVSNAVLKLPLSKWLLERVAGLDHRRALPAFGRGSFLRAGRRYLAACTPLAAPVDKVAYFVDTYANYHDHELGFAVVNVLRHNEVEVILPKQRPAPLPAMVYGNVRVAQRDLSYDVKYLAEAVRHGYKIVCSEPSAALCLKEELRRFVAGDDAALVSQNTFELMNYLQALRTQGKLKPPQRAISDKFVYHLPCHLCAVGDDTVTLRLLQEHFHVDVTDLQAGCCGLSGTFGMQKKNYDLSFRISESLRTALKKACSTPRVEGVPPSERGEDAGDTACSTPAPGGDSSQPRASGSQTHPFAFGFPAVPHVLTECAACKMQIEHLAPAPVTHPLKLLARSYGL